MEQAGIEALLREMESYAAAHHVPIINERGRQAFLAVVQEERPRRILEIGTAIGYSTLLLLLHGAADARVTTLELGEERTELARSFWARAGVSDRITLLTGDAGRILAELPGKLAAPYDFVFIDAAKGQYVDYFEKIQPLLAPHCTVLADNVLFRGYVLGEEKAPRRYRTIVKRLRAYIELVNHTPGFVTEILERGDGLAVTRRK
ncbi:O-methyltransferase [Mitsuokella sp. AF33-22]|uniref:O-methyltransferase n=1 Tax=Mitsuokella sp. AF33-22 TaxID=2292047 RepID=UPI001F3EA1A1|nr:O-methyltransferase [Mitsuokella sp. AF33-22]